MISLLISQLYLDVILFNQKILIVLDSCLRSSFFFIIWVLFGAIQSLNRLPYQIKKKYSMLSSGFHHQIMSRSLLLKELFKIDFDGVYKSPLPHHRA